MSPQSYTRLWGNYQKLASAFHQEVSRRDGEIRELREALDAAHDALKRLGYV